MIHNNHHDLQYNRHDLQYIRHDTQYNCHDPVTFSDFHSVGVSGPSQGVPRP